MKTEELYRIFIEESSGVSTDSRTINERQIYFALWGPNFNGNMFAREALDKGALYAVIDDPAFETTGTILVDETLLELKALAAHHRKMSKARVLAITGSNGKTTTRELVAAILSGKFKVHCTKGNLNNEIGLSLTILSSDSEAELMIVEMGANHLNEIRTLCNIARPHFGMITNFGNAHIEGFGSFEGVVRAKTELLEYLVKTNGIAIYNDRDQHLSEQIYRLRNRAVPYSFPDGFPLSVTILPSEINLAVKVNYRDKTFDIQTNLFGSYNLENVTAAIATGLFLGASMDDVVTALTGYVPVNNRSQVMTTANNTIICDSYNANPTSMAQALKSFSGITAERKVVILGDMLELGDKTDEEHFALIGQIRNLNPEKVLLVGKSFGKASEGTGFLTFPDVNMLMEYLKKEQLKGCHVLVKGSRGISLEKVYDLL